MDREHQYDSVTILGDPLNLARVREFVQSACRRIGMAEPDTEAMLVAVGEACNNAIVHGQNPNTSRITVGYHRQRDQVEFLVADNGPGFSLTSPAPAPDSPEHGRLGIPLMKRLVDLVAFETGPGGTTVHLKKRLNQ